ncbi:DHA2 family efflux MFS transporter permease subunit [Oceaniglobus roseus]|uniref:DHA2 family efflux MFS transporter permease subunit n=1 Tax=Oceaniglobus roseus TaxID=1737570 RepID=UPI001C129F13|nr:DHA2 family efflux MFS transporter permease subunit [Kandeliimicrobium roseum]
MAADLPRSAAGRVGPWVMTACISLPTFMEVLDVSIANVALPQIAGNLGVPPERATWLVTTYLVANAVIIPISGFLSRAIGRKRYFLLSILLFTLASLACALAPSFGMLLAARVLQGVGGGGLAPVEQAMLADSFPPEKRSMAFAAFGIVIVIAPILGPTVGGAVVDSLSWHWLFLLNVPVGILALVLVQAFTVESDTLVEERQARLRKGLSFDWQGFLFMVVGLGALLIMLDRGESEGWFSSGLIVAMTALAVAGLGAMLIWEFNHPDPIVPLPLLFQSRNLAIAVAMMMILGILIFGTIQLIPQMLQGVFGYSPYLAGLALTYGGAIAILMMPVSGIAVSRLDVRMVLFPAFALQAFAFWNLSNFSTQSTFFDASMARFWISLGLPFLFIPITNVAYVGLAPGDADKASAMLNLFRNVGGAFGISFCQTMLSRRDEFHFARLSETLTPGNGIFNGTLDRLTAALGDRAQALATLVGEVRRQTTMLAFTDTFHVLMIAVLCILPFILILRTTPSRAREETADTAKDAA